MSEQTLPGIPAGYRAVRWGVPDVGEKWLDQGSAVRGGVALITHLIVEPIPKPEPEPEPEPPEDVWPKWVVPSIKQHSRSTGKEIAYCVQLDKNFGTTVYVDGNTRDYVVWADERHVGWREVTEAEAKSRIQPAPVQEQHAEATSAATGKAERANVSTDVPATGNPDSPAFPDPGPRWRLIDPAVDTPMEGDELWFPGSRNWGWRPSGTNQWGSGCCYRRRLPIPELCQMCGQPAIPGTAGCRECTEYAMDTTKCPRESPDDWVEITDPQHVLRRDVDHLEMTTGSWYPVVGMATHRIGDTLAAQYAGFRCRRRDLPKTPDTEEITFHQVVQPGLARKLLSWVSEVRDDEIPTGETVTVLVKTAGKP